MLCLLMIILILLGCIHYLKNLIFLCFIKFKGLVENIFSCKIKQFQTDNGGEYLSNNFKQFLKTHGILHRLTCPHSSEQNGIFERKH